MPRVSSVLWVLALTGCYESVPQSQYDEDVPEILARIEALEASNVELAAEVTDLGAANAALTLANADLTTRLEALEGAAPDACPGGCVGQDDLADYVTDADALAFLTAADLAAYALLVDLAGFMTLPEVEAYVEGEGFVTAAWLTSEGYASEHWVRSQGYAAGEVVLDVADRVTEIEGDYVTHGELESFDAEGSVTLRVPDDEPDIAAALANLEQRVFRTGSVATIELQAGTHRVYAPIRGQLTAGAAFHLVGEAGAEGRVFVDAIDTNGVEATNTTSPLTLQNVAFGGDHTTHIGLRVYDSGRVTVGTDVRIEDFGLHGIVVERGSLLFGEGAPVVAGNGGYGVKVFGGSAAWLGAAQLSENGYSGLLVEQGSLAVADGAVAFGNAHGFDIESHSMLRGDSARAEGNAQSGFLVFGGSFADVPNSDAILNGEFGYFGSLGSVIYGDYSSAVDNNLGFRIDLGSRGTLSHSEASGNTVCGYQSDEAGAWDVTDGWTVADNGPSGAEHYCGDGMAQEESGAALASAMCAEVDGSANVDVYRVEPGSTGDSRCGAVSVRGGGGFSWCAGVIVTYAFEGGAEIARSDCQAVHDTRTSPYGTGAWACCQR